MKVSQIKNIVNNEELWPVIIHKGEDELSRDVVIDRVIVDPENKKYIQLFLEATEKSTEGKKAYELEEKLITALKKHKELWSDQVAKVADKIQKKEQKVEEERLKRFPESEKCIESSKIPFCKIGEEHQKFLNNKKYAEKICAAIKDFRREQKKTTFFDYIPLEQTYVISQLPLTPQKAREYVDDVIKNGGTLFVSCHESDEATYKCSNFWDNEQVFEKETVTSRTKKVTTGKGDAKIIETAIQLKNGSTITHLHFDRWVDRTRCPDDELLETLLARMREVSPDPKKPIAINCHGGVGRSACVAVVDLLRKRIDHKKKETALQDIEVNIPRTATEFRKYRSIHASVYHMQAVYSQVANYFTQLSKK